MLNCVCARVHLVVDIGIMNGKERTLTNSDFHTAICQERGIKQKIISIITTLKLKEKEARETHIYATKLVNGSIAANGNI